MRVAIVLFPGFDALDAIGPSRVFAHTRGLDVRFVAERPGRVSDSARNDIQADAGFDDLLDPEIVIIPGGPAALGMARHHSPLVDWLRGVGPGATWTASVGAGAAWEPLDPARPPGERRVALGNRDRDFGAIAEERRVVFDGRVVTAAAGTGIDLGLRVVDRLPTGFDQKIGGSGGGALRRAPMLGGRPVTRCGRTRGHGRYRPVGVTPHACRAPPEVPACDGRDSDGVAGELAACGTGAAVPGMPNRSPLALRTPIPSASSAPEAALISPSRGGTFVSERHGYRLTYPLWTATQLR